jgi:hypothetical protein
VAVPRHAAYGAAAVRDAATRLGIPVIGHDELEIFAAELGGGVPAGLRP